jgi:hypothetical protein
MVASIDPMTIDCASLSAFAPMDLDAARAAFAHTTPIALHQRWLAALEADFAPASVRVGWRGNSLLVFGELIDADIFTAATADNQAFWELGDTFEIFLRPVDQQAYVELHVAPNNHHLHLRFPDAGWLARTPPAEVFGHALRPPDAFESHVWVNAQQQRWSVLASIPTVAVYDRPGQQAGTEWLFSFSRYDYTRGRTAPVISSTSPHTAPSFHRQQEWGRIRFRPPI